MQKKHSKFFLDKGFPKGGGGGGGPTFGKNSQIISFVFFESVPYISVKSKLAGSEKCTKGLQSNQQQIESKSNPSPQRKYNHSSK